MAINIDTVYKTVLLIINKEQRGNMTPDEFNKVAAQVQLEIFESYFDDLNQQLRIPDNDSEYADRIKTLKEKISLFQTDGVCQYIDSYFNPPTSSGISFSEAIVGVSTIRQYPLQTITQAEAADSLITVSIDGSFLSDEDWEVSGGILTLTAFPLDNANIVVTAYPSDFYKLGTVIYNYEKEVQQVQPHELLELNLSPLTKPTTYFPVYKYISNKIYVYPQTIINNISATYLRKPLNPIWNFSLGAQNEYIYNKNNSIDFELHPSEQISLISKILLYAGIVIKDPQIVQVAAQQVQAENINSKS